MSIYIYITHGWFCCAGLPLTVTYVLEVCKQVFALWLLFFCCCKENEDTFPCWTESLHNTAGPSRLVITGFIWRRYWIQLTCNFPRFAVLWSVTGNAHGTSATVTLFWLVVILIWKHPVVRWHCGNEILIGYCRTFNITIQSIVENTKNALAHCSAARYVTKVNCKNWKPVPLKPVRK